MTIWVWLRLILLVLLVLIAFLLASYLRLETCFSERDQLFRLRWLGNKVEVNTKARQVRWWFLGWRVLSKPFKVNAKPKEALKDATSLAKDATSLKKEPREKGLLKTLWGERQRLRQLWRYFKRSIHVEHLELNAGLATPDPVWTGMLYALVSSIIYPLKALYPKVRLHVKADFAHAWPSGRLEATLGVYVFRLVALGLKAFPLVRKLRQDSRKEYKYGSPNPSQGNRRGYASSS
jgi:hypothetical protein